MNRDRVLQLLRAVRAGRASPEAAAETLAALPFETVGEAAVVDHHRTLRTGIPEVVYGESKTAAQIADILAALARAGHGALATRVDADKAAAVLAATPGAEFLALPRIVRLPAARREAPRGVVAVVCAGTSDLPVAEEAAVTAEFLGCAVVRITDVGVAGLHRLLARLPDLRAVDALVVVAGMEGALPSVIAGLVDRPLIAVPTSVGYGVGAGGVVALGTMLSSCAPGVTVTNIDNGFGAAVAAVRIARPARGGEAAAAPRVGRRPRSAPAARPKPPARRAAARPARGSRR